MEALLTEIERDLGPEVEVKIFRLNRDLRFTPDKRPYKEHLGAYLSTAGAGGLYLQISDDGLYLAIGSHEMASDQLNRYRDAVAGKDGEKLARIVGALVKEGYQVTEPSFKRVPSGYAADHPRSDLLRCKGLMVGLELVVDKQTKQPAPDLAARVRAAARERGVLVGVGGFHGNVVRIQPPLVIDQDQLGLVVEVLDEALSAALAG